MLIGLCFDLVVKSNLFSHELIIVESISLKSNKYKEIN